MMAAASKEAAMMYLEQGKEYLDEKARETKETSKKQKEKKEEQEERIEAIQEKTEQMEGVIESTREKVHEEMEELVDTGEQTDIMVETEQIREDIQAELQKMLAKLGLSEEDLKGVEIDKFL